MRQFPGPDLFYISNYLWPLKLKSSKKLSLILERITVLKPYSSECLNLEFIQNAPLSSLVAKELVGNLGRKEIKKREFGLVNHSNLVGSRAGCLGFIQVQGTPI